MAELKDIPAADLAPVFEEWDRRYRADPEGFMSEAAHLLKTEPKGYGEQAAAYFAWLVRDMRGETQEACAGASLPAAAHAPATVPAA